MSTSRLFKPVKLGHCQLKHRMALAPLTRLRATTEHVPGPDAKLYYEQRASVPGTLLVTEATFVSLRSVGYATVPGIWNDQQVDAWRDIVKAVHDNGSFIFAQIWGLGRVAGEKGLYPNLAKHGYDVVSSSAGAISAEHVAARALSEEEIGDYVKEFATAARNAIAAGFDGVEIHGANGYLIEQFWRGQVNKRTDKYGGSIENRARFGLEVTRAVIEAVGNDSKKVGIRLSPWFTGQGIEEEDSIPEFSYIIGELKKLDLAYLHLVEPRIAGQTSIDSVYTAGTVTRKNDSFVQQWGAQSPILLAGGFDGPKAKFVVDEVYPEADIIPTFGRNFISTPDLPFRIQNNIPLAPYDRSTFYSKGEVGYTTYPFSKEFLESKNKV